MKGSHSSFGGSWSDIKLQALKEYLNAYLKVLKKQPFKKYYIDAFAGQGANEENQSDEEQEKLFDSVEEIKEYRHGSPMLALDLQPKFDHYIFIDSNQTYIENLEKRVQKKFSSEKEIMDKIKYHHGDANDILKKICKEIDWYPGRAVLFLDPFAMQVEWKTIEAVSKTKAIDLWLLFPIMALNRMLKKDGNLSVGWRSKINKFYGTEDWYGEFYKKGMQSSMFEEEDEKLEKIASFEVISKYTRKRLKAIFPGVSNKPLLLKNSKNSPLFLFCFACGNRKGAKIAVKIANYIIGQ